MTKRLLLVSLNLIAISFLTKVNAQTVLNGGFENWTQSTYLIPDVTPPTDGFGNSNERSFGDANVLTLSKVPNGGGSAMRIETKSYLKGTSMDTATGFAIWGHQPQGSGIQFNGGFPFTDKNVTSLKVDMRYNINPLNAGLIFIQFKKNGVPIDGGNSPANIPGVYVFMVGGIQSTFTTMTFNISPALTVTPDTCAIGFISNNPNQKGIPGNYMEIDNLVFTGTSQTVPAGNLDSWVNSPPIEHLTGWTFEDNSINYKTTDKNSGNFAVQLPVLDRGGGPNNNEVTRAYLGTVTYGMGFNTYSPGMALTGNPKSIGVFYKYSSPGIDTGSVYIRLTRWNGTSRDDVGYAFLPLTLQANYGYVFAPINYQNGMTADSAYVEIASSFKFPGNVAGSLLTVDDIQFNYCNQALSITGSNSVCANSNGLIYTVQGTPLSTYSWTTPAGSNITAGGTTDTITLNYGSTPGLIQLIKSYADGCPDDTATLSVGLQGTASADANLDQTICANGSADLNGSVTGASGGVWSGGAGTYSPDNATLNATYVPTLIEIIAGSVTLTLTTTGNGSCSAGTDNITIFINPAPTADAGIDQTSCNNASINLSGSSSTGTGQWSGGAGTFSPNNNALNPTYTPSSSEISSGSAILNFTTTGGTCPPVSDQMTISIDKAPTADAGVDQSFCAGSSAALSGSVANATFTWTTSGSGTFIPNATTFNATYIPSAADIAGSIVTITIITGTNGSCSSASDQINIIIDMPPTANAGADKVICSGSNASLVGTVTNCTGGIWTSSGTGTFSPSSNVLNATYIPSAGDIASGIINLTLTTTGNGNCSPTSDQMELTITPPPTANAGGDQTICDGSNASLSGTVMFCTGGTWTSSGTGSFANANSLTTIYVPSAGDIASGVVDLTLTTTGNGFCSPASDQLTLTISTCTGLNNSASTKEMKIYPSPSSSIVNIELKSATGIMEVTVMNSMSQVVHARVLEINGNKATVDLSALNAGIYLIRVSDGQSTSLQKVIKE